MRRTADALTRLAIAPLAMVLALAALAPLRVAAQSNFNRTPTATASTTTAETSPSKTFTNSYCDDRALDQYSQRVTWNGVTVTSSFPWVPGTPNGFCGSFAKSTGTLTANFGLNTYTVRVCDQANYSLSPPGPLCSTATYSIRYRNVDVTPDNVAADKAPNRTGHYVDFQVKRFGTSGPTTFGLTATCSGSVSGCSVQDSVSIPTSGYHTATVRVTFTTGALGTTGTVTLRATTAGTTESYNEGSFLITNRWPSVLTADVSPTNNDNQALGVCAEACFAAAASASTVPYISMDAPRSVTLFYHGDRVAVRPFVHANVSVAPGGDPLRALTLEVTRSNGQRLTFLNGDSVLTFGPGLAATKAVRLAGQFDAIANGMGASGMYPATITVTAKFDDHDEVKSFPTKLLVLNERASPIARGWTVAGIQRLLEQTTLDSSILIVDGDGSAVYFAKSGSGYTAPPGEFTKLTVSGAGANREWVRATPDSTKSYFNYLGLLKRTVDRFGNSMEFGYDSAGRLTRVYDPFREVGGVRLFTELRYGTFGLSQIEEPGKNGSLNGGRITNFTVGADSLLSVLQDPDLRQTRYGYDAQRRLVTIAGPRHDTLTYVYRADSSWKLASFKLPKVKIDVGGGTTTDSVLVTSLLPWQTIGVPIASTVPFPGATPPAPVAVDSVEAVVTDPAGHATRIAVDRWGQPLRVTDAVGNVTRITRNADGLPTEVTSPTGGVTRYSYTGPFLTTEEIPLVSYTYFTYGDYGQLRLIQGNGPTVQHYLGPMGRVDSTKTGGRFKISYTYDSRGRITQIVDPESHTTTVRYETVFGNQDSVRTPGGDGVRIRFDRYGRDSVHTSTGRGPVTKIYDQMNRLVEQYDGLHPTPVRIAYDGDLPSRVVDPKGQISKTAYNALGWPVAIHDMADTTRFVAVTYSADGLAASRTDLEGRRVELTYDAIHRVKSRTDPLAGSAVYDYDAPGLRVVTSTRDRNGTTIALDSTFIATTGWTDSVSTWLNGQRFRRYYRQWRRGVVDSTHIHTTTAIAFNARRWYVNSSSGQVDSMALGSRRIKLTYNADGQRHVTTWAAGVTRTETWTSEHRPSTATFAPAALNDAFKRGFGYDDQERIERESRFHSNGNVEKHRYFEYDAIGELRRVQRDSVKWWVPCGTPPCPNFNTYTLRRFGLYYDAASNLTRQADSLGGGLLVATIDPGNRLRAWGGASYTYDLDGNLVSRTISGSTTTFGWGGAGQLLWAAAGTDTIYYDYDAHGQLLRRRKSGGVIDRWYLWDQGQLLAELNPTAASRLAEYAYYGGVDQPLAVITGATGAGTVYWVQQSGHGNVDGLLSTGGTVMQSLVYDEWGKLEAYSSSISDSSRLRWKGLLWEGGPTGLYYVRARWYDPHARRFVSQDPIGLAGGINPYIFGGNDPINMADPSGLDPSCPSGWNCGTAYLDAVYSTTTCPRFSYTNLACTSARYRDEAMTVYRRMEYYSMTQAQYQYGTGSTQATEPLAERTAEQILQCKIATYAAWGQAGMDAAFVVSIFVSGGSTIAARLAISNANVLRSQGLHWAGQVTRAAAHSSRARFAAGVAGAASGYDQIIGAHHGQSMLNSLPGFATKAAFDRKKAACGG